MIGSPLHLTALLEATGEVVATDLTPEALTMYADARRALADLENQVQNRTHELIAADPILEALGDAISEVHCYVHAVEHVLAGLWSDDLRCRAGTIRVQAQGVAITWPKPATVWEQGVKPEQIANRDPRLAEELRIHQVTRKAAPPRITIDSAVRA